MSQWTRTPRPMPRLTMLTLTVAICPLISRGQGSSPAPTPEHKTARILYHPQVSAEQPLGERVGGGARGVGGTDAALVALVPKQVALTASEQPSLFWLQSKQATAKLELTLIEPGNPKPLLVLSSPADKAGLHRVKLANHGTRLKLNDPYKWTVSLIPDPANRSLDIVATGMVKRVAPSPELAQKLATASEADRPALYAQAGIWYDALEAISDAIDKSPGDSSLWQERTDLLKQVGLPSVGKHFPGD